MSMTRIGAALSFYRDLARRRLKTSKPRAHAWYVVETELTSTSTNETVIIQLVLIETNTRTGKRGEYIVLHVECSDEGIGIATIAQEIEALAASQGVAPCPETAPRTASAPPMVINPHDEAEVALAAGWDGRGWLGGAPTRNASN
jgi:hypothetical protein